MNQCLYNHMGIDVTLKGKCRNGMDSCEDCRKTKMTEVYSIHHTTCRKPWLCQATGALNGKKPGGERASAINTRVANVDHCLEMTKQWHSLRLDFENALYNLTKDDSIYSGTTGDYRKDVFLGHCTDDGRSNYLKIGGSEETKKRVEELYI